MSAKVRTVLSEELHVKKVLFFFVLMTGKLAFGFHSSLNNELECKVR